MANATTAVPTATQVAISACSTSPQPKCRPISGSNVPNRMKSYTANTQAKNAIQVAKRTSWDVSCRGFQPVRSSLL